jgi:hypothetical protein
MGKNSPNLVTLEMIPALRRRKNSLDYKKGKKSVEIIRKIICCECRRFLLVGKRKGSLKRDGGGFFLHFLQQTKSRNFGNMIIFPKRNYLVVNNMTVSGCAAIVLIFSL